MRIAALLFFQLVFLSANSQSLAEVRKQFHLAVLDPEYSSDFHKFLEEVPLITPTHKAYKASSEAMLAREMWNPFRKYAQVLKYEELITEAIQEDSANIEIRFLRISIEYNLPRFLGKSKHLHEDRDIIVQNLSLASSMDIDPDFCHYIIYFLKDTELCTPEEVKAMEEVLRAD